MDGEVEGDSDCRALAGVLRDGGTDLGDVVDGGPAAASDDARAVLDVGVDNVVPGGGLVLVLEPYLFHGVVDLAAVGIDD